MSYWILGWGGDVEVLAPEELCNHIAHEARQMASLYQPSIGDVPA